MRKPTVPQISKKNNGLTRRTSGLMALEARFMFDGAAVDTAVDTLAHPDILSVDAHPLFDVALDSKAALGQALQQVQTQIRNVASHWTDAQWMDIFGIKADDTQALASLHEVQRQILDGSYQVHVLEVDAAQMGLSMAAFAAKGPDGRPTVFLNKAWWSDAEQDPRLMQALVEEVGHSIDAALHPQQDTPGDEGQLFAVRVLGLHTTDTELAQMRTENDADQLSYNGQVYEVEHASFNFTTAYALAPEYRYYAEKEQESDRFLGQSLGVASISDNTALGTFSGNDVVVDLTIGGATYHGWISRPIKDQGVVRGFYFWYDPSFTTFALATADGNQDGDSNATNNRGFVLVVDQNWFNTITSGTAVHDNGSVNTNVYEVGSSSDRVDSALNSVLPVNVAPVANTDTSNISLAAGTSGGPALEAGGLSNATAGANAIGNVLSNDTDANGDTLKVTAVGVSTSSSGVASSSTSISNGTAVTGLYGTLTLGADGSYKYVINETNAAVQALRLASNTLTDSFTYSIVDTVGLASSAKINIVIQGANDTPVAANDYNTAKESLLSDTDNNQYTTFDPLGQTATGNVLINDADVDGNAETKAVVGMSISGSATGTTSGAGSSVTTLSFSALPGNVSAGYYVFIDGDNTANNSKGSLTALTDSNGNQLTINTIDSAAKTFTLSGAATQSLSSTLVLGFSNKANGSGAYKDSTITSAVSTGTTNISLSGTITGTIAVGMTETSTGAQVASVTYDATTGKATSVALQGTWTLTNSALTFAGSTSSNLNLSGQYGSLLLNADGSYVYTPTANNSAISQGQSYTEIFNYTMKDALNATSTATLYITVQGSGTNDPNAQADTATAVEAGGVNNGTSGTNPSGNLLTNDSTPGGATNVVYSAASLSVVSDTTVSTNTQITGLYGVLTLSSSGSYTYTVDNNNASVQALHGAANTLTEVFRYTVRNGLLVNSTYLSDTSTVTFTIQGANDAPVAINDNSTAIEASGYLNNSPGYNPFGNVLSNDSDVDDAASGLRVTAVRTGNTEGLGAAGTLGTALNGLYGSLTLNADGSWTYVVNNSNGTVNALTSGQTLIDNFNYTVMDSSGTSGLTDIAVLSVTIQGADDTLAVNNIFVNEASPYAVFTVSGATGMSVQLSLGTTGLNSRDRLATLGSDTAATNTLEYLDGTTWRTYDAGNLPVMPSGNQLLVRIAVTQDAEYEGNESFTLTAISGSQTAVGIGTINDEGAGDLYPDNTTGNQDTTSTKDDDRPLSVTGYGPVNEGSQYAMFTVTATPGYSLDLDLQAATSGTAATRAGFTYEYSTNGTTWTTYDATHKPTVPVGGKVYVRVDISSESDAPYEGAETFALKASYTANLAKSAAADTTIVDDGTGTKYGPNVDPTNGPATNTSNLDDDRAKPAPLSSPPVTPALPPARPADPAPLPPVATPPQAFSSTLAPLAPRLVPAEPPVSLGEVLTSGNGYRAPVSESAPVGLSINRGVTDQFVKSTEAVSKISLPFDAFIHSNKDAVIKLEAKKADNSSLPKWVQFDPATGVFEVMPPQGFKGKLDLKVLARDDEGREAVALFQMFIGEQAPSSPQSRDSFSEKLRMAGKRPITLVRVSQLSKTHGRDGAAIRVRAG